MLEIMIHHPLGAPRCRGKLRNNYSDKIESVTCNNCRSFLNLPTLPRPKRDYEPLNKKVHFFDALCLVGKDPINGMYTHNPSEVTCRNCISNITHPLKLRSGIIHWHKSSCSGGARTEERTLVTCKNCLKRMLRRPGFNPSRNLSLRASLERELPTYYRDPEYKMKEPTK